jgi:hypothetical protein
MRAQDTATRPLNHSERGRLGGRARWGDPRVVRLDRVHPHVRAAIVALIDADRAARNEKASAVSETPAEAELEGRRRGDELPAA